MVEKEASENDSGLANVRKLLQKHDHRRRFERGKTTPSGRFGNNVSVCNFPDLTTAGLTLPAPRCYAREARLLKIGVCRLLVALWRNRPTDSERRRKKGGNVAILGEKCFFNSNHPLMIVQRLLKRLSVVCVIPVNNM